MKIISKSGKKFLRISKSEWARLGSNFGVEDAFDWLSGPSESEKQKKKQFTKPEIAQVKKEDYTTKNPLKSMPETPSQTDLDGTSLLSKQRSITVEHDQAYEVVPKKDGTIVKKPINLIGISSQEDLQKIQNSPQGYQESVSNEIIRDKIRSIINSFKNKQFIFIGFWEKTNASTWRHMWGQIIDRISGDENKDSWYKLKILDKAIGQVREVLIDNIDYIRGGGASYVVDRIAANAHVNEKYPDGKANFVGSALSAARQALEQGKGGE